MLDDAVSHPIDLKSTFAHHQFRKCYIHKWSYLIFWPEDDDMIIKLSKFFVDERGSRIDRELRIFIVLLKIEEFFGKLSDSMMERCLVLIFVLDHTQFAIGRIIVTLSEYFLFFKKSVSIKCTGRADTIMMGIVCLDDNRRSGTCLDQAVELYKSVLSDRIVG